MKIQIRFSFENTDLVLYEKYRPGFCMKKYRLDFYEKYRSGFLEVEKNEFSKKNSNLIL